MKITVDLINNLKHFCVHKYKDTGIINIAFRIEENEGYRSVDIHDLTLDQCDMLINFLNEFIKSETRLTIFKSEPSVKA